MGHKQAGHFKIIGRNSNRPAQVSQGDLIFLVFHIAISNQFFFVYKYNDSVHMANRGIRNGY